LIGEFSGYTRNSNTKKRIIDMKKRFSKVMLAVILLSVLTSTVIMMPSVKAQTVSLSSSQGVAGSIVTITVSGFAPSENVSFGFSLNEPLPTIESIGSIIVDSTGSGSINFTIPNAAALSYNISAIGQRSGDTASYPFNVIASTTASPTSTSAPTPTPTVPEFPTFTIALLFIIMVMSGLLVYYKKHKR
jgi:hypothetical protein